MSKIDSIDPKYKFAYECGKNFFYSGLDESYYKVENLNNSEEELIAFRAGFNSAKEELQTLSIENNMSIK